MDTADKRVRTLFRIDLRNILKMLKKQILFFYPGVLHLIWINIPQRKGLEAKLLLINSTSNVFLL